VQKDSDEMAADDVIAFLLRLNRRARRRSHADREAGFTIIELVVAMALLAVVAAPMAGVFWSAIRTAGIAAHRTDGASIASREMEGMRAIPYAQVGFYDDQTPHASTFESFTTVSLGTTSPSSGTLIPQLQPATPDPNAAIGYAPDPYPANALPIVQGNVQYTIARYIVWVNAQDASSTYAGAYKRLTAIVTWTDQGGAHTVRQDSLLYPGGQGTYQGAMGGSTTTTSTTIAAYPAAPILNPVTAPASPADQTQAVLSWSQPGTGAAPTSYTIEYSTNPSFPAGNFTIIAGLAPSITNYTVTGLTPSTRYYFQVIAYAGANSATSGSQSIITAALTVPGCILGGLNVAGAETLSTTGTRLKSNGGMSENLTLSWSTSGTCTHSYQVRAVDPTATADPGSPYSLSGSSGSYSGTVPSNNDKNWAVGLHTFNVWDVSTGSATSVVKTFKVCVNGAATC
jgi:prepilin-type N-terminal cleavage/methylation domain-containing protein